MRDAELKRRMRAAFGTGDTEKRTAFIGTCRKRELSFAALLVMQLRYMKTAYAAGILGLAVVFAAVSEKTDGMSIGMAAAFMPLVALAALAGLGRARRHGMTELEMSARFSLRMLKSLRLTIVGAMGIVGITCASAALKLCFGCPVPEALYYAGLPYLITTAACMLLIRKWHAKENIYGCAAIAAGVCVLSLPAGHIGAALGTAGCAAAVIAALLWTLRELYAAVRESEELQWNLC